MEALNALWTFPAIILAAMLIAWAAECGQFYIAQGLALAILAWIQTLPEFAVEAVIAWDAAHDPAKVHLVTANYTGSLRLFIGLGWPMVYFISLFFGGLSKEDKKKWSIKLDDEHSIAVLSLVPAMLYFVFIYFKGYLSIFDSFVLIGIYCMYLFLLSKMPPKDKEELEDLGRIPKLVMKLKSPFNIISITLFFIIGAVILYFSAHPFLNSMLSLALTIGISQFVFVQWVAPFLSEFPEQLSAFNWARTPSKAPMSLINFVSSSINQWTILVAMVPFIYSLGCGRIASIIFDDNQKVEILLTIIQSFLGFLFLFSLDFKFYEAFALLLLWLIQFFIPTTREEIIWVYGAWALIETVRLIINFKDRNAFHVFLKLSREHLFLKKVK